MKQTTTTMQVKLTQEEADLVWRLIINARKELHNTYGQNCLTERLSSLLDKFIFPDSAK